MDVWWAAKPLANVVDLDELEHQLNDELWTCTQLVIQLAKVNREVPSESPAPKGILDQIADRKRQLAQLRDEYEALYAETGADPATVTDAVREALLHAQALNEHRPIADTVTWTQSLREIVAEYNTRTEQVEQIPES
ncbi:hypothetical protein [Streptomyces sp. NPDC127197]|uniref:hypothetical protein n=1 Tax=Streptomyces sp. NPDC127197 TaxID=3345388 RepID=UPI003641F2AA